MSDNRLWVYVCRKRRTTLTPAAWVYRGRYYWTRRELMRVHGRARDLWAKYGQQERLGENHG